MTLAKTLLFLVFILLILPRKKLNSSPSPSSAFYSIGQTGDAESLNLKVLLFWALGVLRSWHIYKQWWQRSKGSERLHSLLGQSPLAGIRWLYISPCPQISICLSVYSQPQQTTSWVTGLVERSSDLVGRVGQETKAPPLAPTLPLSPHVGNLWTSPSPSSAFFSIGQTGDFESLNLLVPQPPSYSHLPASSPAREAEIHANCSDEAMQKNQTSVFNTDDRLACGEFSHPSKQASFCSKQMEQEGTYASISQ